MKLLINIYLIVILINQNLNAQIIIDNFPDIRKIIEFGNPNIIEFKCYSVMNFKKDSLKDAYYKIFSKDGILKEEGTINIKTNEYQPTTEYLLVYEQNNRIVTRFKRLKDSIFVPIIKFSYDSLNRIEETVRYYSKSEMTKQYINGGENEIFKRKYHYYNQNDIANIETFKLVEDNWKFLGKDDFKQFKKINNRNLYRMKGSIHQHFKYKEIDNFGNWTKRIEYFYCQPVEIVELKIVYY